MSWYRVDDKSHSHHKVIEVGNAAWGAHARMGAWSKDHQTDGKVPRRVAQHFASETELSDLLRVGLLHETEAGYELHDFLDWNDSAEEQRKAIEKKKKAGRLSAKSRLNTCSNACSTGVGTPAQHNVNTGVGVGEGSGSDPEGEPERGAEPPSAEDRYAEAYAQGQRDVSKAPYPAPVEPWERGAIARFTQAPGWGHGLRGEALLDAIRAWSRAYRQARDEKSQFEKGFPPTKCEQWARGAGWRYRPPKANAAPRRPVDASERPMAPQEAAAAAKAVLGALGGGRGAA